MEIVTLQPTTINREMFNAALLAMASPYIVGVLDAENNAGNQAHDRYTSEGDIAEYVEGYTDTRRMMAVAAGKADFAAGGYNPPHWNSPDYDGYMRGWNDGWADANKRTIWC